MPLSPSAFSRVIENGSQVGDSPVYELTKDEVRDVLGRLTGWFLTLGLGTDQQPILAEGCQEGDQISPRCTYYKACPICLQAEQDNDYRG